MIGANPLVLLNLTTKANFKRNLLISQDLSSRLLYGGGGGNGPFGGWPYSPCSLSGKRPPPGGGFSRSGADLLLMGDSYSPMSSDGIMYFADGMECVRRARIGRWLVLPSSDDIFMSFLAFFEGKNLIYILLSFWNDLLTRPT